MSPHAVCHRGCLPVTRPLVGGVLTSSHCGKNLKGAGLGLVHRHGGELSERLEVLAPLGTVRDDKGLPAARIDSDAEGRKVVVPPVVGGPLSAVPRGGLDGPLGEVYGRLRANQKQTDGVEIGGRLG